MVTCSIASALLRPPGSCTASPPTCEASHVAVPRRLRHVRQHARQRVAGGQHEACRRDIGAGSGKGEER